MKLWKLLAATATAAVLLATPAMAQTRIALVVKSLGNGFFDAAAKGAEEAAAELGDVEVIYTGPTTATAEATPAAARKSAAKTTSTAGIAAEPTPTAESTGKSSAETSRRTAPTAAPAQGIKELHALPSLVEISLRPAAVARLLLSIRRRSAGSGRSVTGRRSRRRGEPRGATSRRR